MDKKGFKGWLTDEDNMVRWKDYVKENFLEENPVS